MDNFLLRPRCQPATLNEKVLTIERRAEDVLPPKRVSGSAFSILYRRSRAMIESVVETRTLAPVREASPVALPAKKQRPGVPQPTRSDFLARVVGESEAGAADRIEARRLAEERAKAEALRAAQEAERLRREKEKARLEEQRELRRRLEAARSKRGERAVYD